MRSMYKYSCNLWIKKRENKNVCLNLIKKKKQQKSYLDRDSNPSATKKVTTNLIWAKG